MHLGRNGGSALGAKWVRIQDTWTARESEPVNMVLLTPKFRVPQTHSVPAGCWGTKPMHGIAAARGVLRGQRAASRILHTQHQLHRRAKSLGGGVANNDVTGLGFERPDIDVLAREDATIGGNGQGY